MRIAIVSTPRSGNSWVRAVLRDALDLTEIAVHNPRDIPASLPPRVVLQLHWYREPNFQAYLAAESFRILVMGRHPLDALISAWHFAPYEPQTARWLEGNAELPAAISGHPPASPAFLAYATSWGAENFLGISYQWWHDPAAIRLRYEDCVQDPPGRFARLFETLAAPNQGLRPALEKNSLLHFQRSSNRHGWQGRPGLWRSLLPPLAAIKIWRRHHQVFKTLGYPPPLSTTPRAQALKTWHRLT